MFPNLRVLYLPEEYMENKEEFYSKFFLKENNYYDLCFGHGTFKHIAFTSHNQESEKSIKTAPEFNYEEMNRLVKGPIIFGHFHKKSFYKQKIYYPGSFSRWCFGEEEDKGFIEFSYSSKTNKHKIKFIKNILVEKYITIDFSQDFREEGDIDEKIKKIEELKNNIGAKFLRVKIDKTLIDESGGLSVLKEYFSDKGENVKVMVSSKINKKEEEMKKYSQYDFIFEKKFELPKVISLYLKKHNNISLKEEIIKEILYSKEE